MKVTIKVTVVFITVKYNDKYNITVTTDRKK